MPFSSSTGRASVQVRSVDRALRWHRDKLLFDLGLRKNIDYPGMKEDIKERWQAESRDSVPGLLKEFPNVTLDTVTHIVLSHLHFDHVGMLAQYDKQIGLVLGPREELSNADLAKSLHVEDDALEGREIRYLSRDRDAWQDVGAFKGHDFYGDGSMWLLDAPGHAPGHIAALVRTEPGTWHLLAGDGAHHVSLIDAKPAAIGVFPAKKNPASDQSDPERLTTFDDDPEESVRTMARLARMDQEEGVNVWLAHDASLGEPLISSACEKLSGDIDECYGFKGRDRGKWPIKGR